MADLGDVSKQVLDNKPHAALSFPMPDSWPDVSRVLPPAANGGIPPAATPTFMAFG